MCVRLHTRTIVGNDDGFDSTLSLATIVGNYRWQLSLATIVGNYRWQLSLATIVGNYRCPDLDRKRCHPTINRPHLFVMKIPFICLGSP